MIFSSSLFLFAFFPFFFGMYLIVPTRLKDTLIIIASIFFYIWGAGYFALIIVGTTLLDWLFGKMIHAKKYAKLSLISDIVMNIGLLLYFKYTNFFIDNANAVLQALGFDPFSFTRVIMPLGISFVIFQKMTYCLDISMGKTEPERKFFYLLEYVLLFPKIIMGPIVSYNEMAQQIRKHAVTWGKFNYGFQRFTIGLFKKVWIADNLAPYANNVFSMGPNMPFDYAWFGVLIYLFQLFFDFSGYSDMAIGLMYMMGFETRENFENPLISKSITEFWKRWHISLTDWFRTYLYSSLALAAARKKPKKKDNHYKLKKRLYDFSGYFILWFIFLVSGFWHGAGWTFIIWGIYSGLLLCLEKAFLLKYLNKIPKFFSWLITLLLLLFSYVLFRSVDLGSAMSYFKQMFDFSSYNIKIDMDKILLIDPRGWVMLALAMIISWFPAFERPYNAIVSFFKGKRTFIAISCFVLFVLSALKVITAQFSPFLYFNF